MGSVHGTMYRASCYVLTPEGMALAGERVVNDPRYVVQVHAQRFVDDATMEAGAEDADAVITAQVKRNAIRQLEEIPSVRMTKTETWI